MTRTRKLADDLSVCTFVTPEELPALAREFRTIINNRPDGEETGQSTSAEIEAAARKLGLDYIHLPVVPGQIDEQQVDAFGKALAERPGAKLAFCKSGMRAATLWALSEAGKRSAADILAAAAAAGYDLKAIEPRLRQATPVP